MRGLDLGAVGRVDPGMQVKHLDHLNLSVASFADTADWYRRVFDFEIVEEGVQDGKPWGVIKSGEALLCIYEHPRLEKLDRFQMGERGLHFLAHFGLRVTDEEEWLATVKREGLAILYDGPIRWPHATAWYLLDPTGWEIEVALWDDDRVAFD
jgi:catechol 2,3-dioxygenase-like lactoylglutathione lyase family enzyme